MPDFIEHTLDYEQCSAELDEFRTTLAKSATQTEKEMKQFFEARLHLTALIGSYSGDLSVFDRVAREYPLFGDFRCDYVIGDSERKAFLFVEFEDAKPNSVFEQHGAKFTSEWGRRFEHGYSQLIDWFYKLQMMTDTEDMENRFGKRAIDYEGLLVIGRRSHLSVGEQSRLEWRRRHVLVNSKRIACVTYDHLLDDLNRRLQGYRSIKSAS